MTPSRFLVLAAFFLALSSAACAVTPPFAPSATATTRATAQPILTLTGPPAATSAPIFLTPPAATTPVAPTLPAPVPSEPGGAAAQTITLSDNGRTITLKVGERFLLSLGDNLDWSSQMDDPAIVSRLPNILTVRGSQGLFEAHQAGRTKLTATGDPACRKVKPPCMAPSLFFQLQIVVSAGSRPTPAALATDPVARGPVTYADNGRTINLRVGDRFLLMLDDRYHWDVTEGDPTVVSRDPNITVAKGQGIYRANRPGETTLSATGTIVCPPQQACPMLALGFNVRIVVQ